MSQSYAFNTVVETLLYIYNTLYYVYYTFYTLFDTFEEIRSFKNDQIYDRKCKIGSVYKQILRYIVNFILRGRVNK